MVTTSSSLVRVKILGSTAEEREGGGAGVERTRRRTEEEEETDSEEEEDSDHEKMASAVRSEAYAGIDNKLKVRRLGNSLMYVL